MTVSPFRLFLCSVGLILHAWTGIGSRPVIGDDHFATILNPATYRSASGRWSVVVDPDERHGERSATYRFAEDGNERRVLKMPFTLADAVVANNGAVLGYGYSNGRAGGRDAGDFIVAIIDREGKLLLNDVTPRQHSRFLHMAPNPIAEGIVFDESDDRLVIRVRDDDINRAHEEWRIYRPTTAALERTVRPAELMPNAEVAHSILDARPIRGTPLTLVHWWSYDRRLGKNDAGGRFTLVDRTGNPIWTLDLPGDYCIPGNEAAEDRLRMTLRQRGGILRHDEQQHFDVYLAAKSQRVTYSVLKVADKFVVTETGSSPYSFESAPDSSLEALPEIRVQSVGATVLQRSGEKIESPIRAVQQLTFDGDGRLAFLRAGPAKNQMSFVRVDQAGKLLTEIALQFEQTDGTRRTVCCWIGGSTYLVTTSELGFGAKSRAWWVDTEKSTTIPVTDFDCPTIERLIGFPDGTFMALTSEHFKYTIETAVVAFDRRGRRTWKLLDNYNNKGPDALFGVKDIAGTTEGDLVVLENIRKKVKVFDRQGHKRREFDLEKVCNRDLNYPASIAGDANGGFLVEDFHGTAPVIRLNHDGTIRSEWTPTHADGRAIDARGGFQTDPVGRVWASEGDCLVRMTDSGVVDLTLGQGPQGSKLSKIAGVAIDRQNRILAVDERTGEVHVFDAAGTPVHVCATLPTEFMERISEANLSVGDNGDIFLGLGGGYVSQAHNRRFAHFGPSGTRFEDLTLPAGSCWCQPQSERIVALRNDEILLADRSGKTLRTIRRRPNNDWLEMLQDVSFAADGRMAVLGSGSIDLFEANGDPVRSIELPSQLRFCHHVLYDGRQLIAFSESSVVLLNEAGTPRRRVRFPGPNESETLRWIPMLTPSAEIVLVDIETSTLHRYQAP